jgi:hypothetical protein
MKLRTLFSLAAALLVACGCEGEQDSRALVEDSGAIPTVRSPMPLGLHACSRPDTAGGLGNIWWGGGDPWYSPNQFIALISEAGEFRMVEVPSGLHIKGTFQASGTGFVSTDAVWVSSTMETSVAGPATVQATQLEDRFGSYLQVSTDLSGNGGPGSGVEPMYFYSCYTLYHHPSSLELLQGTYVDGPNNMLTIDSTGSLFYQSSSDHCTGNGSVKLLDPAFNLYAVEIEVEGCTSDLTSERNGLTFTGLAYLGSTGWKPDNVLVVAASAEGVDILGVPRFVAWNLGVWR